MRQVPRTTPPTGSALDVKTRAAMQAFRSRRTHLCARCGQVLLLREESARTPDGQLVHVVCTRPQG